MTVRVGLADLVLTQQNQKKNVGGHVRILKNGNNLSLNFRQHQNDIESIAGIALDSNCELSEGRFTFYNQEHRPIQKMRVMQSGNHFISCDGSSCARSAT